MKSLRKSFGTASCGLMIVGTIALGGCSEFEPQQPGNVSTQSRNIDAAQTSAKVSQSFDGQLAENYSVLANRGDRGDDWTDSDYFARKSLAASNGGSIMPEQPYTPEPPPGPSEFYWASGPSVIPHLWLIAGNATPTVGSTKVLTDSRQQLVALLDNGGRGRYPALAARTQAYYDCWVERSEHLGPAGINDPCRAEFLRDYTDLATLLYPPQQANAYFAHDSAELTPEGQQALEQAAAKIKHGTAILQVIGKADRTGSDKYNMALSERRAQAIRTALVADGLPENRIQVQWTGERPTLPIPTNDGVSEPKNRVVQIDTQMPTSQVAALPDE